MDWTGLDTHCTFLKSCHKAVCAFVRMYVLTDLSIVLLEKSRVLSINFGVEIVSMLSLTMDEFAAGLLQLKLCHSLQLKCWL